MTLRTQFYNDEGNIYPHVMLIKRQSVMEVPDIIIHLSEWQPMRYTMQGH